MQLLDRPEIGWNSDEKTWQGMISFCIMYVSIITSMDYICMYLHIYNIYTYIIYIHHYWINIVYENYSPYGIDWYWRYLFYVRQWITSITISCGWCIPIGAAEPSSFHCVCVRQQGAARGTWQQSRNHEQMNKKNCCNLLRKNMNIMGWNKIDKTFHSVIGYIVIKP